MGNVDWDNLDPPCRNVAALCYIVALTGLTYTANGTNSLRGQVSWSRDNLLLNVVIMSQKERQLFLRSSRVGKLGVRFQYIAIIKYQVFYASDICI